MAPPALLDAQSAIDRHSTFFDTITDESKERVVGWALRICPLKRGEPAHTYGLLFDVDGTFSSVMPKVSRKLTITEGNPFPLSASGSNLRRFEFVVSNSFARQYDVVRCLGSSLKDVTLHVPSEGVLQVVATCARNSSLSSSGSLFSPVIRFGSQQIL